MKPIGVEDDFFELGGHSLMAARIVSEIEKTLGKSISLDDFYHAPTIRTLSRVIKASRHLEKKERGKLSSKHHVNTTKKRFHLVAAGSYQHGREDNACKRATCSQQ